MLQGIAGALLGPVSYEYGAATAAMGLAMHFGVAFTATSIFYWLSRRIPAMVEFALPSGILFGVFWLLVMYRGVIPLTARCGRSTSKTSNGRCRRSGRCLFSST